MVIIRRGELCLAALGTIKPAGVRSRKILSRDSSNYGEM